MYELLNLRASKFKSKFKVYTLLHCDIIRQSYPVFVTERWARSWSWCTGSQPAGDFILRPVPGYAAWWQRHIGVKNLPKVVTQLCPGGNLTHDWLQVQRITVTPLHHPLWYNNKGKLTLIAVECCTLLLYYLYQWKIYNLCKKDADIVKPLSPSEHMDILRIQHRQWHKW